MFFFLRLRCLDLQWSSGKKRLLWSRNSGLKSNPWIFYFLIFSATASAAGTRCPKFTIIVNSKQIKNSR